MPVLVIIIIMISVFYINIVIIVRVPGKRFPAWLLDDYSLVKKVFKIGLEYSWQC